MENKKIVEVNIDEKPIGNNLIDESVLLKLKEEINEGIFDVVGNVAGTVSRSIANVKDKFAQVGTAFNLGKMYPSLFKALKAIIDVINKEEGTQYNNKLKPKEMQPIISGLKQYFPANTNEVNIANWILKTPIQLSKEKLSPILKSIETPSKAQPITATAIPNQVEKKVASETPETPANTSSSDSNSTTPSSTPTPETPANTSSSDSNSTTPSSTPTPETPPAESIIAPKVAKMKKTKSLKESILETVDYLK